VKAPPSVANIWAGVTRATPAFAQAAFPGPRRSLATLWAGLTRTTEAFNPPQVPVIDLGSSHRSLDTSEPGLVAVTSARRRRSGQVRNVTSDGTGTTSLVARGASVRSLRLLLTIGVVLLVLLIVLGPRMSLNRSRLDPVSPDSTGSQVSNLSTPPSLPVNARALGALFATRQSMISVAVLSPDGRLLATVDNAVVSSVAKATVSLWDVATGELVGEPLPHPVNITSVAFSADGSLVATTDTDGSVRLWNPVNGAPAGQLREGPASATGSKNVRVAQCGGRLAVISLGDTVSIWDPLTGQPLGPAVTIPGGAASTATVNSDCQRLAITGPNATIFLWDRITGRLVGTAIDDVGSFGSPVISPDGRRIATGTPDGAVRLWDGSSGQPVGAPLTGHSSYVTSITFTPDSRQLMTAAPDGTIRVWDPDFGRPTDLVVTGFGAGTKVVFAPDGRRFVTIDLGGASRLWSMP
jgi:WD40 repeat protein